MRRLNGEYSTAISNQDRRNVSQDAYHAKERETRAFISELAEKPRKEAPLMVTVRQMRPGDINYIIDSWVSSYRHSPDMQGVDERVYKIEMRNRIYREISRNKTFVAVNPEDEQHIYGWICFKPPRQFGHLPVVSYVYVKRDFWLRGIGANLVDLARASGSDPDGPVWCFDWTLSMRKFADKVGMMRNPFLREAPQGAQEVSHADII